MKRILPLILSATVLLSLNACSDHKSSSYTGYIEGRLTMKAAPSAGRLTKLNVKRGAKVTQGQALFSLVEEPELSNLHAAQAEVHKAEAELKNIETGKRKPEIDALKDEIKAAEAKLEFANKQLSRHRKLAKRGNIQQEALDESVQNVAIARSDLLKANNTLKTALLPGRNQALIAAHAAIDIALAKLHGQTWLLAQKAVKADNNGRVFDTYYRVGEQVPANQPVLSVLVPAQIHALFFVPESKLAGMQTGQQIDVHCDGCNNSVKATIDFISPKAEFTPPVIYSKDSRSKLVYRVEAGFSPEVAMHMHPGQPITVSVDNKHGQ